MCWHTRRWPESGICRPASFSPPGCSCICKLLTVGDPGTQLEIDRYSDCKYTTVRTNFGKQINKTRTDNWLFRALGVGRLAGVSGVTTEASVIVPAHIIILAVVGPRLTLIYVWWLQKEKHIFKIQQEANQKKKEIMWVLLEKENVSAQSKLSL